MMGIEVEVEIEIARQRSAVAEYMFDPANDAEWTTGVVECRPLSDGRLHAGSRVERTTKFLGKTFSYIYEVVDADEDSFVEMTVDRPFPMQIRYELEQTDHGTLARIRTSGEASGFFSLAAPLLSKMVRRNITKDLRQLRDRLETPS